MTRYAVSMSAMTVHRPPERVNTLCRVISEESPGARLKAYIEARWGRKRGGMEALASAAGLRGRQTLYEWFAGGEPSLASLKQVADALNVRRVDLVAAYDGVTAPETEEAPRPGWAEGLEERIAEAVAKELLSPRMLTALQELGRRAEETPPPSAATAPEDASAPSRDE